MRIDNSKPIYKFDKNNKPVLEVDAPVSLIFDTKDCFHGFISGEDKYLNDVDYEFCNPTTGPVCIKNAKVGDVLEVKIKKIDCHSPGYTMAVAGDGFLADYVKKDITKFIKFDHEHWSFKGRKFKLAPMIGVIGVAPAEGSIVTASPGDHGGNMDTTMICEGSTVFLPVFTNGGMLGMGDVHAAMGDGESFYMGLEVQSTIEADVSIRRDMKIDIPFVLSENRFASIATDLDIESALRKAMKKLVDFVVNHSDLDFYEAGIICGLTADLQISQVVDVEKTARMAVDVDVLKEVGISVKL